MPENTADNLVKAIENANVTIALKGLGLCNYNEANENWELIFISHDDHNLDVTVNKFVSGALEESNSYDIDPNERIFIRSNRAVKQSPRHESGDDLDITGFVDFSSDELYGGAVKLKETIDDPLIFLSISDSTFYTKELTHGEFSVFKDGQAVGNPARVGMVLGGDIVCEVGGMTEILFNSEPNKIPPLVAEENVEYEVVFDNTCPEPPADATSDFDLYAESFDMPNTFTMTAFGGGNPKDKHPPCHKAIITDLDNIDSLADLLS